MRVDKKATYNSLEKGACSFMDITKRYENLLKLDSTHINDRNRKAMFYLLSCNDDIYRLIDYIYDFNTKDLIEDVLEKDNVSSSYRAIIKLAFNLFNERPVDVSDVFCDLDSKNFDFVVKALEIKYK